MSDIETGDKTGEIKVLFDENDPSPPTGASAKVDSSLLMNTGSNSNNNDKRSARNLQRTKSQFKVVNQSPSVAIRSRNRVDIETGKSGLSIECTIEDVTRQDTNPQNPKRRLWKKSGCCTNHEVHNEDSGAEEVRQYRVRTARKYKMMDRLWNISGADDDDEDLYKSSWTLPTLISIYLNWTFRVGFWTLFLQFACTFWAITLLWALFILAAADYQPICMQVAGVDVSQYTEHSYIDAYALSWQTFSTVGYGVVYPQTSPVAYRQGGNHCFGINFLVALEAFVGILYVATCGAIIFGKIAAVQSLASAQFADPLVIKYATGVSEGDDDEESGNEEGNNKDLPFPVLEIRVVNYQHSGRGEIINASVKCVAVINESKASDAMLVAAGAQSNTMQDMDGAFMRKEITTLLKKPKVMAHVGMDGLSYLKNTMAKALPTIKTCAPSKHEEGKVPKPLPVATIPEDSDAAPENIKASTISDQLNVLHEGLFLATGESRPAIIDEGSDLVPRRIFSQVELTNSAHPSFKRSWIQKHVLNEKSPLLKGKARKMIADNGGKWPEELNTYDGIRDSIYFDELVVTFNGTSNATGANVYTRKVYNFSSVNIGYCFAGMLYVNKQGVLSVDGSLLNDVVEQRGGGGEPFGSLESNIVHQALEVITAAATKAKIETENTLENAGGVAGTVKDEIVSVADHVKDGLQAVANRARMKNFEKQTNSKEEEHGRGEDVPAADKKST